MPFRVSARCKQSPGRTHKGVSSMSSWQTHFSPSVIQASLQTSNAQVSNHFSGAAVGLLRKRSAKNLISPRYGGGIHLALPASQPDTLGFSEERSDLAYPDAGEFTGASLSQPQIAVPVAHPLESRQNAKTGALHALSKGNARACSSIRRFCARKHLAAPVQLPGVESIRSKRQKQSAHTLRWLRIQQIRGL